MPKINYYKFIFYFCIFIIILLSVYPGNVCEPSNECKAVLKKYNQLNHFISYFIAGITGFLAYPETRNFFKLLISLLLLAIFLEIIQIWIPKRSFEFLDMLSNNSGVVIGLGVIQIFNKIKVIKK